MENNDVLKNAQYRKSLSIAFFNATNSAISMLTADKINMTSTEMEAYITKWRDWFLEEHKNYHATVIANVGVNYRADESIKKLKEAKTIDELKSVWIGLSEDERRDGEIISELKKLKKSYEKA